jgi:beta-phosphoglucomutase
LTAPLTFPSLGSFDADSRFIPLDSTSDGRFSVGTGGVNAIAATGDRKVEFIAFPDHTLAFVTSALGYPAYYPIHPVSLERPVKAVLMDLDGTSVRSEEFWIWIIEQTTASLLGDPDFRLSNDDEPYVSGHSVSEHLQYCIEKYAPTRSLEDAREFYFEHTHREMNEILEGRGRQDAFTPTPGLKPFLLALKERGIKIGLVTSGLYEKAYPEILSAFRQLDMGDPAQFYDAIITAGFPLRKGESGTLGELSPKPHPWLYSETCRVGLGIPFEDRNSVIGIEDSGAGVASIRLAGYATVGFGGGNIDDSGTRALCDWYVDTFKEVLDIVDG